MAPANDAQLFWVNHVGYVEIWLYHDWYTMILKRRIPKARKAERWSCTHLLRTLLFARLGTDGHKRFSTSTKRHRPLLRYLLMCRNGRVLDHFAFAFTYEAYLETHHTYQHSFIRTHLQKPISVS